MITIAGTMITIAGGIILAVLFFVFLPQIIRVASAVFAFALILGGLALVAVLLDPASAVVLAIVAGVTLIYAMCLLKISINRLSHAPGLVFKLPIKPAARGSV